MELAIKGFDFLYSHFSCPTAVKLYKFVGRHSLNLILFSLAMFYWVGAAVYAIATLLLDRANQYVDECLTQPQATQEPEQPQLSYNPIPQYEENYLMDASYSQVEEFAPEVMMPNLDNLLESEPEDVEFLINQMSEATLKNFDAEYQPEESEWVKYLQSCKVVELRKLAQSKGISIRNPKNKQILNKQQLIELLSN